LRDHYGVNWLQVISANKMASMPSSLPTEKEARERKELANKTEDDIYLNDSTAGLHERSAKRVCGNSSEDESDGVFCEEAGHVVKDHSTLSGKYGGEEDGEDDIEVIASDGEGEYGNFCLYFPLRLNPSVM